jgi:hypothetical protein
LSPGGGAEADADESLHGGTDRARAQAETGTLVSTVCQAKGDERADLRSLEEELRLKLLEEESRCRQLQRESLAIEVGLGIAGEQVVEVTGS